MVRSAVRGRQPEAAGAVVDPELVGVLEIVGDVEVLVAVPVDVVEANRQAEALGIERERPAVLVAEAVRGEGNPGPAAGALVEVEEVGVGALHDAHAAQVFAGDDPVVARRTAG